LYFQPVVFDFSEHAENKIVAIKDANNNLFTNFMVLVNYFKVSKYNGN
jgi:hypothetical protein